MLGHFQKGIVIGQTPLFYRAPECIKGLRRQRVCRRPHTPYLRRKVQYHHLGVDLKRSEVLQGLRIEGFTVDLGAGPHHIEGENVIVAVNEASELRV